MDHGARAMYLETQVMTAPPQRLRLMLIEGAIRFGRQALRHWDEDRQEAAWESLVRCRSVVAELLCSVQHNGSPLTGQVAAIYLFLFQTLTAAQAEADRHKLETVLEVLDVERETWRLVCEQGTNHDATGQFSVQA